MFRSLLIGWSIALSAAVAGAAADPYAWAINSRLIAHALGGIDGYTYTNCREAFVANYAKGQRIFEVDLSPTSDGQRACIHDWSILPWFGITVPPGQENQPLSLAEFKSQKIHGIYTTMGFADVVQLLHDYPDTYLVTDTKITTGSEIGATFSIIKNVANYVDPGILNRILPEIYNQPMYDTVMAIYPFKACLYTIYGNPDTPAIALAFMGQKGIRAISIPTWWATPSFLNSLKGAGIYSYVWDVSAVVDDIWQTRTLIRQGVYGFYTNFLLPYQVNPSATRLWRIDLPVE